MAESFVVAGIDLPGKDGLEMTTVRINSGRAVLGKATAQGSQGSSPYTPPDHVQRENNMAKGLRSKTDDVHIAGVERIDASPENIAALFEPNDKRARAATKARRKQQIDNK